MNQYEAMVLFKTKDAKEDWDGLVAHFGDVVSSASGTVTNSVKWDEKKLAYDIKGQSRAAYMLVHFEAPPTAVDAIHRKCKLSDKVMRLLIVKADGSATEHEPEIEVKEEKEEEIGKEAKEAKEEEADDGVPEQSVPDRKPDEGPGA